MKKLSDYETSHFTYDPVTGLITHNRLSREYITPNNSKGYIVVGVHRKISKKTTVVSAHRLAWYLHYGTEPEVVDHINHDKTDNRISNLVSTTVKGNSQNKIRAKKHTYLPCAKKRVSGNYAARAHSIKTGKLTHFGTYTSELDAHYVATYYKQANYANYYGADLPDINGLPHPYFTGELPRIVATILDTKGKSVLNYMHK